MANSPCICLSAMGMIKMLMGSIKWLLAYGDDYEYIIKAYRMINLNNPIRASEKYSASMKLSIMT